MTHTGSSAVNLKCNPPPSLTRIQKKLELGHYHWFIGYIASPMRSFKLCLKKSPIPSTLLLPRLLFCQSTEELLKRTRQFLVLYKEDQKANMTLVDNGISFWKAKRNEGKKERKLLRVCLKDILSELKKKEATEEVRWEEKKRGREGEQKGEWKSHRKRGRIATTCFEEPS